MAAERAAAVKVCGGPEGAVAPVRAEAEPALVAGREAVAQEENQEPAAEVAVREDRAAMAGLEVGEPEEAAGQDLRENG